MPASPTPSVQVTFTSLDDHEEFPERVIIFGPNSKPVPVGRSSKNIDKGISPSANNVFIDSPVVSRDHAFINATANGGVSTVTVKDTGSMHGTLVNNEKLKKNMEHKLNNGDVLQFGMNVERGQDTFIAKKFRVNYHVTEVPVSRGFSVPELESEEESIDDDHSMLMTSARHPRYGSQAHPVNVDDFDDLPAQELEGSFFESPPAPIVKSRSETAQTGMSSPCASPLPVTSGIFSTITGQPQRFSAADGNDSDDEDAMMDLQDDATSVHSSEAEVDDSDEAASLSGDESIHDSDVLSDDESDASNDSVDEDPANDQELTTKAEPAVEPNPPGVLKVSFPPVVSANATTPKFNHPSPSVPFNKETEPQTFGHGVPNTYTWACTGSSLPRPPAPRPFNWAQAPPREILNPWFEDMAMPTMFNDYRADGSLNGNPSKAEPPRLSTFFTQPTETFAPALPTTAVKEEAAPSFRRTKLSIPEIVEAVEEAPVPEQPPTPVSLTSRKRKAEVLDEEPELPCIALNKDEEEHLSVVEKPSSTETPSTAEASNAIETLSTETRPAKVAQLQAERPKKKLKTALRYAAAAMAGLAVGVVGVTTTLVALPEGFFQP